jgi:hypothetical protein
VVKVLQAEGPDLVVADADAAALRGARFLAEGRVVVVID